MQKSKIGYVEWGLVFGAFVIIDICQWGIDLIPVVGEVINAVLDVFIALVFVFYLYMRGVISFGGIITQAVGFLFKEGTLSTVPWTIEVLVIFFLTKAAETKLSQKVTAIKGKLKRQTSVAGMLKTGGTYAKYSGLPGGNIVGKVADKTSTYADRVKTAAGSVLRNNQKFSSPFTNQPSRVPNASPRFAQLSFAQQAVSRNNFKMQGGIGALQQKVGKQAKNFGSLIKFTGAATNRTGQAVQYGGKGVKYAGDAAKYTGKSIKVAGKGAVIAGKAAGVVGEGLSTGGNLLMDTGGDLSATGLGAVVGVPLAVLGGAVSGLGKAAEVGGKVAEVGGKVAGKVGESTEKIGDTAAKVGKNLENEGKTVRTAGKNVQKIGDKVKEAGKDLREEGRGEENQL